MTRRIAAVVAVVAVVVFAGIGLAVRVSGLAVPGLAGLGLAGPSAGPAPGAAPPVPPGGPPAGPLPLVEVAQARKEVWTEGRNVLGNVKAARRINVATDVAGRIVTVAPSAAAVGQGSPLIVLDDSVEQAQLRQKLASFELARSNARRADALVQKTVSEATRETARTEEARSLADVEVLRATIRKLTVQAPFGGLVGFHDLAPGQYVQPGQTLFTLQDTSSFTVEFSVPEADVATLVPDVPVDILGDGDLPVGVARVRLVSPEANTANRTVLVRAEVPGSAPLRVGMSVRVSYNAGTVGEAVTLPGAAIVHSAYGQSVFIVRDGAVEQRFIAMLGRRNGRVAIARGVGSGEVVVTAGQMRLYPGARVRIAETGAGTPTLVSEKPQPLRE